MKTFLILLSYVVAGVAVVQSLHLMAQGHLGQACLGASLACLLLAAVAKERKK